MSSALGSMTSLAKLFGLLEVSGGDREGLKAQCGIDSIGKLMLNRENLARSPYKTCHLLVASIDFIAERKASLSPPHDYSTADQLFTSKMPLEQSWEHYLARMIEQARNEPQETATATRSRAEKGNTAKQRDGRAKQKVFRNGDVYWEEVGDVKMASGTTDMDELGIAAEDSPWQYDEASEHVVLIKEPKSIRIPKDLFKMLFSFQRAGIAWLSGLYIDKTGGILGDQMGMGKTMQTLTFLFALMSTGAIRNALVVCPKSILEATWLKEAKKLIPFFAWKNEPRLVLVGTNLSEHQKYQVLKVSRNCTRDRPHLCIASYPQVQKLRGFTSGKKGIGCFDYVALDEAHRVKNTKTIVRKNLQKIAKYSRKLLLTGTPFLNETRELYSLLELAVGTDVVGEWPQFRDLYVKAIEAARQPESTTYQRKRASELVIKLQALIRPYLLQRKKSDFMKDSIPPCFQFDVWTKLSPLQRKLYEAHVKSGHVQDGIATKAWNCCLPEIQRLRRLCNHPLLFQKDQEEAGMESVKDTMKSMSIQEIVSQSPKLSLTVDLMHKWRSDGLKVLLFCHSVQMLDIIQYCLSTMEGIDACRIDGSTCQKRRTALVEDFNRVGSRFNVMLLSIETGGEGLTLIGANKSILFDPAWNQAKTDQAVARTSRPGQTRQCECIHLLTAGAVEEKMFGKQIYKGSMDRTVLGNSDGDGGYSQKRIYDKGELTQLFALDPPGKCESLELFQQSVDGAWTKKCSTSKEHPAVVGISRRSIIYKDK